MKTTKGKHTRGSLSQTGGMKKAKQRVYQKGGWSPNTRNGVLGKGKASKAGTVDVKLSLFCFRMVPHALRPI